MTFWKQNPHVGWGLVVFATTALLTYVAFPPVAGGDAAFVLALPPILWAYRSPPLKLFCWSVLGAEVVAWLGLLGWLHNVTWLGLFLLAPFVGLLIGSWFLAAWWMVPRLRGQPFLVSAMALISLAALWVILEWFRGWVFGGFPWLPLAASQWRRPFMLQIAAYAGSWAISFVLICFNLGSAAYVQRIFFEDAKGLRKRGFEFFIGLLVLMVATFPFLGDTFGQHREKILRAALVQPDIPQEIKWDESKSGEVLHVLENETLSASSAGALDAIIWPEAATPWALQRDSNVAKWLNTISHRIGKPLLLGTVSVEHSGLPYEQWYNAAVIVDPIAGVQLPAYAKRKLVLFGEYVPLRLLFSWLEKFVPIGGDFVRGASAAPLRLPISGRDLSVGVLICYEDVFPQLARSSAQAGAEVLAVLTNNAWFGEGGAAYQHAAHSVLRAVENRRPLVRCGNAGWSGWIDEYGTIHDMLTDDRDSIYFRGYKTVTITKDRRWRGRLSFYAENGDWFLFMCTGLATLGFYLAVLFKKQAVPQP